MACAVSVPLIRRDLAGPADAPPDDVARAVGGDTQAFERVYRRHVGQVWSLARRLLGPTHADDVTQEIFLQAWRRLPQYRGTGPFGAWLMVLARNLAITRLARSRSRPTTVEGVSAAPARCADPLRTLELDAALDRLPERARQVLVLRHFAGCTHEEIARLLAIDVGTSKSQLHRARGLLRRELEDGGGPR